MAKHWFKHDCAIRNHISMRRLRMQGGAELLGCYWHLIEEMHLSDDGSIDEDTALISIEELGVFDCRPILDALCSLKLIYQDNTTKRFTAQWVTESVNERNEAIRRNTLNASRKQVASESLANRSTDIDIDIDIDKESKESIVKQKTVLLMGDSEGFERFWSAYDKKRGKPNAMKQWAKLTQDERRQATEAASAYASATEKQYRKDPERWLRGKHWQDEVITTTTTPTQPTHGERTTVTPEYYTRLSSEIRELESATDAGTVGKLVQAPDAATGLVSVNGDTRRQATRDVEAFAGRPRALDMGATSQGRVVDNQGRLDNQGHEADS